MNIKLKKVYTVTLCMLMTMAVQLKAENYTSQAYCRPNNCMPCEPSPCCSEIIVKAELLYWRPELCGLESAFGDTTIATSVAGGIITTTVTELDEEPESQWTPGFRIGAATSYSCFDIEADWTHYYGRATFNEGTQYGSWKINYNAADLIIGRNISLLPCFVLEPYIGLRAVHIHQTLRSHLETLFTAIIGDNTVTTDIRAAQEFWGLGPQIGLAGEWDIGCNLCLYGSVGVVSYYGDVDGSNFNVDTFTSTVSICNGREHCCFNNIATDAEIGFCWNGSFCSCGCDVNLMLKLGVEQHRIYELCNFGSTGTLSMDGGVFGAGVGICF